jgi:serine protease SohB
MDFLSNFGLFFFKTITILTAILIVLGFVFSQKKRLSDAIKVSCLNEDLHEQKQNIIKKLKWKHLDSKLKIQELIKKPKIFILDFNGDLKASQSQQLRDEITSIVSIAQPGDEVMIRLDSPGGSVNGYGLAASQIERLRQHHLPITVCIDQVAASGGYLMACIADKILAAPFAIVGSIGVVSQLPNFNKWLKKHDIDFEQITAGEYKRTLTIFGENTNEGRKKYAEDLEKIHHYFKQHVCSYRPQLQIEKVATGEHWLASDGMSLGLIDELKTSDEWILERASTHQLIHIKKQKIPTIVEKFLKPSVSEILEYLKK